VLSQLGAKAMIPNSVLRIMSDSMAGLAHLTMLYLDWLAKQLLPDTAETEWLDRHGHIWLVNSDGSTGRKAATYAQGDVRFEGSIGFVVPVGTILMGGSGVEYQTTVEAMIGSGGFGMGHAVALTAGKAGNLPDGTVVSPRDSQVLFGVDVATCYGDMTGGVEQETDDQLRERILFRIQNPPMGGSQADYVRWATAVPGVTRAWASAELGPGTMTVRFLMDDLYPPPPGMPTDNDIIAVYDYVNSKRPVTVKDCFVLAPIPFYYDIEIRSLTKDDASVRARIEQSIRDMEFKRSKPGQTWYRSWVDEAISQAVGEETHELIYETQEMPNPASMPVLGTVLYDL
jgi:uncharacterized phage protein gp47/JayE